MMPSATTVAGSSPSSSSLILRPWGDAATRGHHCGVCLKVLSNERAIQDCYGTHVVCCWQYHPFLFQITKAHTCQSCRMNKEQHAQRHIKIAELIVELRKEVDPNYGPNDHPSYNPSYSSSAASRPTTPITSKISDLETEEETPSPTPTPKLTKRKRKLAASLARTAKLSHGHATSAEVAKAALCIHGPDEERPCTSTAAHKAIEDRLDELMQLTDSAWESFAKKTRAVCPLYEQLKTIYSNAHYIEADVRAGLEALQLPSVSESAAGRRLMKGVERMVREDLGIAYSEYVERWARKFAFYQHASKGAVGRIELHFKEWDWKTGDRIMPVECDNQAETGAEDTPFADNTDIEDIKEDAEAGKSRTTEDNGAVRGEKVLAADEEIGTLVKLAVRSKVPKLSSSKVLRRVIFEAKKNPPAEEKNGFLGLSPAPPPPNNQVRISIPARYKENIRVKAYSLSNVNFSTRAYAPAKSNLPARNNPSVNKFDVLSVPGPNQTSVLPAKPRYPFILLQDKNQQYGDADNDKGGEWKTVTSRRENIPSKENVPPKADVPPENALPTRSNAPARFKVFNAFSTNPTNVALPRIYEEVGDDYCDSKWQIVTRRRPPTVSKKPLLSYHSYG